MKTAQSHRDFPMKWRMLQGKLQDMPLFNRMTKRSWMPKANWILEVLCTILVLKVQPQLALRGGQGVLSVQDFPVEELPFVGLKAEVAACPLEAH